MRSGPLGTPSSPMARRASSVSSLIRRAYGSSCSPALVSDTPRGCRRNSGAPSSRSSAARRALMLDCTVCISWAARVIPPAPATARKIRRSESSMRDLHPEDQAFCGKPRLIPPWLGSSQREVTTLPRVKKCTPSVPCAWVSPNSEFFQPPNE